MAEPILKALSVRAPWWWFILHGGKDIENRDWPTRFRGTVYLHASKWWRQEEVHDDSMEAVNIEDEYGGGHPAEIKWAEMKALGGHIVGTVDIVDCIQIPQPQTVSPWFFGDYGFVLRNPVAFETPVQCKGALGFFTPPVDALRRLEVR